jgi:hypothetical protein
MYLDVIKPSKTQPFVSYLQYMEAVRELGNLRSSRAVDPLIERLKSLNLSAEKLPDSVVAQASSIIDALKEIGSPDACESIVEIEVRCTSKELKNKARNISNILCR